MKLIEASSLGNTFLIVDYQKESINHVETVGREMLKLKGADSLLLIKQDSRSKLVKMRVLEQDGSESKMCGNGLRAVAEYFRLSKGVLKINVQTLAGVRSAVCLQSGGMIETNLGKFNYHGKLVDSGFELHDTDVGEPHVVIFEKPEKKEDLFRKFSHSIAHTGHYFAFSSRRHTRNINVVSIDEKDENVLENATYERGVRRETEACGTGAACVAATYLKSFKKKNKLETEIEVRCRGGNLLARMKNDEVILTGTAQVGKIDEINIMTSGMKVYDLRTGT